MSTLSYVFKPDARAHNNNDDYAVRPSVYPSRLVLSSTHPSIHPSEQSRPHGIIIVHHPKTIYTVLTIPPTRV
jgi:hypothetical protein